MPWGCSLLKPERVGATEGIALAPALGVGAVRRVLPRPLLPVAVGAVLGLGDRIGGAGWPNAVEVDWLAVGEGHPPPGAVQFLAGDRIQRRPVAKLDAD